VTAKNYHSLKMHKRVLQFNIITVDVYSYYYHSGLLQLYYWM